jgi:predicted nucleic acid-binding protein
VIAIDTSVAVAALASWHEQHGPAHAAVARGTRLIAQVAVETYAVLTRLPPPHRMPPELVLEFLRKAFSGAPLTLPPSDYLTLLTTVAAEGITGGAVYDGLIAATATLAGATLLTLDQRALPVYRSLGARVELLG